jgi:hypothetical protein
MFGMGGGGMGGGGFGGRGGNANMRYLRIGAIVVLLLSGVIFHHSGPVYDTLRFAWYGLVIGGLAYGLSRRRARGGQMGRGGFGSPMSGPNSGGGIGTPGTVAPPPSPGWYPEPGSAASQRYWDGQTWGARRRWNGAAWIPE